jgi:hypothetical protein
LGHQDKNPWNVLDRPAYYNCEMDRLAKERLGRMVQNQEVAQSKGIEGEPWPLFINQKKVCQNFVQMVLEHISGSKANRYWEVQKKKFGEGSFQEVDTQATEEAMKQLPLARQHWLAKQATGLCAVGKQMKRRKEWSHAKCPRCDHQEEDAEHVLRCQGSGAKEHWETSIEELAKWMRSQQTAPAITNAVCEGLNAWYNGQRMEGERFSSRITNAIEQQTRIGWRNLLEGFPAKAWAECQDDYWQRIRSKRSARRWVTALVIKLANTAWRMWDHRNAVNHEQETNTFSREINSEIQAEYALGFANLGQAARSLARQAMDQLLRKGIGYRQQWLRSIKAARAHQQVLAESRQPAAEILQSKGWAWWIRNGRPSLEEFRAMESRE